jgi:UDP-N-acetylglucosamine diphosphorylase/glucosamine-1-phosphate N-acetyltransferase
MQLILFDYPDHSKAFLPFTFTRPVSGMRIGILTIAEKWSLYSETNPSILAHGLVAHYLPPVHLEASNLFVCSALLPDAAVWKEVSGLDEEEALVNPSGELLAVRTNATGAEAFMNTLNWTGSRRVAESSPLCLNRPWHLFKYNGRELRADFALLTKGRVSQPIDDPHTIVYGKENVFLEEGVKIKAAIINAEDGPIYLGKNSHVHEGVMIHGPLSLGEGAHLNMGAKLRGDNTIGPWCKVGGEVSNSIFFGYSNKGHDGFVGNSVIGEWCNLGADTNTSNLKNNYAEVRLWSYASQRFEATGEQFCGLMMGDHSKCGINTMFNTGTVVGVGANIFGAGYPRNFIPSFSWGGAAGMSTYKIDKFYESAEAMMSRRGRTMSESDRRMFQEIFDLSASSR